MPPAAGYGAWRADPPTPGRGRRSHRNRPACRGTMVARALGDRRAAAPAASGGGGQRPPPGGGGPWGGGGGPGGRSADARGGPGPLPDLDQLIAQAAGLHPLASSAAARGGARRLHRRARPRADRPSPSWRCGSPAASTACSRTSRAWCCASAPSTAPRCPASTTTCPGRSRGADARGHPDQPHRDRLSLRPAQTSSSRQAGRRATCRKKA